MLPDVREQSQPRHFTHITPEGARETIAVLQLPWLNSRVATGAARLAHLLLRQTCSWHTSSPARPRSHGMSRRTTTSRNKPGEPAPSRKDAAALDHRPSIDMQRPHAPPARHPVRAVTTAVCRSPDIVRHAPPQFHTRPRSFPIPKFSIHLNHGHVRLTPLAHTPVAGETPGVDSAGPARFPNGETHVPLTATMH